MCPYAYYSKIANYNQEIISCRKNKEPCPFTRYCNKVSKIIPNDVKGYTMEDCKLRYEVDIPKNSSKVRKEVSDEKTLYVDIVEGNEVYTYKFKNPYNKIPDYVYVQETISGYEIVSKDKKNDLRTKIIYE